jgi:hypothetical protein
MAEHTTTAPRTHRRQAKQRGVVRVELRLREEDADLLRGVARAMQGSANFKELLASAPLEGVDLERAYDAFRTIEH